MCRLWPKTSRTLRIWIDKGGENLNRILFPNAGGGTLSTDGATYILDQSGATSHSLLPKPEDETGFSSRRSPLSTLPDYVS